MPRKNVLIGCMVLMALPAWAEADAGGRWLLQTSLWTTHYTSQPEHNERQELLGLEWQAPAAWRFAWQEEGRALQRMPWLGELQWLAGGASFRNSFSQRSIYLYGGARYDLFEGRATRFYAKLTAGLMNGYRGEYRDKIPLNRFGTAPVLLPSLGLEYRNMNLELVPFGAAGLMLNAGVYVF